MASVVMGLIIDAVPNSADGFRMAFLDAGLCVVAAGLVSLALINPGADRGKLADPEKSSAAEIA
jgi:hypothetical protein